MTNAVSTAMCGAAVTSPGGNVFFPILVVLSLSFYLPATPARSFSAKLSVAVSALMPPLDPLPPSSISSPSPARRQQSPVEDLVRAVELLRNSASAGSGTGARSGALPASGGQPGPGSFQTAATLSTASPVAATTTPSPTPNPLPPQPPQPPPPAAVLMVHKPPPPPLPSGALREAAAGASAVTGGGVGSHTHFCDMLKLL